MKPWKANIAHWGLSTIDQETVDGPSTINGVPHRTIAHDLDPAKAKAIVEAHNEEVASFASDNQTEIKP